MMPAGRKDGEPPPGSRSSGDRRGGLGGLARKAGAFSGPVLVSQALGVVREAALAGVFGAGLAADAFFAAFRLPNLLRDLLAENATSAAIVPTYTEIRARRGRPAAVSFAGRAVGTWAAAATAIALAGTAAAEPLVRAVAPGFAAEPEKIELTARLAAIMFPFLVAVSAAAVLQGILQAEGVFWTTGAASALFNVALIAFALGATGFFDPPIVAMAWAVLVGGLLQVVVQGPALRGVDLVLRPRVAPGDADVRRAARLMGPAVLGSAASIVMVYANTAIASFAGAGAVSYLQYAFRVMHVPLGLVGVTAAAVLLPALASARSAGRADEARATLHRSVVAVASIGGAAMIALVLLAGPLVRLLFERGAFTPADAASTVHALRAYAPTVLFGSVARTLASSFHARQDTRTPALAGAMAVAVAIVLNVVAVFGLGLPFWAIAAGTSAASAVQCALLVAFDRRRA